MAGATSSQRLKIGEVAARAGLSLRTIRYYEEMGLVVPETRTEGGFRLYTEDHLHRLALIRRMKPLGFTLEVMRDLLEARDRLRDEPADETSRQRLAYIGYFHRAHDIPLGDYVRSVGLPAAVALMAAVPVALSWLVITPPDDRLTAALLSLLDVVVYSGTYLLVADRLDLLPERLRPRAIVRALARRRRGAKAVAAT